MRSGLVPLRRIAALSVAVTLFTATIASAQSLDASPSPAKAALLGPAAFARLVQPVPSQTAPAPVLAAAPRVSLVRRATMARQSQAAPAWALQQKSWGSRYKWVVWLIVGVGGASAFAAYALSKE